MLETALFALMGASAAAAMAVNPSGPLDADESGNLCVSLYKGTCTATPPGKLPAGCSKLNVPSSKPEHKWCALNSGLPGKNAYCAVGTGCFAAGDDSDDDVNNGGDVDDVPPPSVTPDHCASALDPPGCADIDRTQCGDGYFRCTKCAPHFYRNTNAQYLYSGPWQCGACETPGGCVATSYPQQQIPGHETCHDASVPGSVKFYTCTSMRSVCFCRRPWALESSAGVHACKYT